MDRQLDHVRARRADASHARWRCEAVVETHARAQRAQRLVAQRRPAELRTVCLGNLKARIGQAVGQLSVVGEQQQPRAVDVQPADRVKTQPSRRNEFDDSAARVRVARRGHHADGLVERVHHARLDARDRLPVQRHAAVLVHVAAGSVTTSSPTLTRPVAISASAERLEATPRGRGTWLGAWSARGCRRMCCNDRSHGPRSARADARRAPRAAVPRAPGVGVGRQGRRRLRADDGHPRGLRDTLARELPFSCLSLERQTRSRDGTVKALFATADGRPLEAVLMRYRDSPRGAGGRHSISCPHGRAAR